MGETDGGVRGAVWNERFAPACARTRRSRSRVRPGEPTEQEREDDQRTNFLTPPTAAPTIPRARAGNNIQALGLHQLESLAHEKLMAANVEFDPLDPPPIEPSQSRVWCVGTAVFIGGSLLNFASYTLAAQSLLASLESIQFVSNLIFGKFVHYNVVTKKMIGGTALIMCGVLLTISSSSSCEVNYDVQARAVRSSFLLRLLQLFLLPCARPAPRALSPVCQPRRRRRDHTTSQPGSTHSRELCGVPARVRANTGHDRPLRQPRVPGATRLFVIARASFSHACPVRIVCWGRARGGGG